MESGEATENNEEWNTKKEKEKDQEDKDRRGAVCVSGMR